MPKDLKKVLQKLDRPPAATNWVRYLRDEPDQTAKAMLAFLLGIPPFNYRPGYAAIKDRIELGISRKAAITAAERSGSIAGRVQNREFVEAFLDYDEVRRYSAASFIEFDPGFFLVSRDVRVPVAPLSIIREHGQFVPIFVSGWSTNPLSLFQRRLYATLQEDAFLSLTDFTRSPAETLFFPKVTSDIERRREPEVWKRGDYSLLSKGDIDNCVEVFLRAREKARLTLIEKISAEKARRDADKPSKPDDLGDLFDKKP